LVFTDPQPNEADIQSFYEDDYHSNLRQPGASEKEFAYKFDHYCEWLLGYLKPGRSLDIGCTTGLFVKKLQDRGFQAEGYEGNTASAAWGRSQYGLTIHTGFFNPRAWQGGSYDLITLCDVLEHTVNPLEYLRAIGDLLAPGGHVMVTFPHIWCVESLYYRSLSKLLGREWLWQICHVPYHTWEFTPQTARQVFERAGFRIVAFRRWQPIEKEEIHPRDFFSLLRFPTLLLKFPPVGNRFGRQMRFLLRPFESI
jgi:SAM-dependent methyltransferase